MMSPNQALLSAVVAGALLSLKIKLVTVALPLVVLIRGLYMVAVTRNVSGVAHYCAAVIISSELVVRMAGGGLFWEFGKYSLVALFVTAMFVEKGKRNSQSGDFALLCAILLVPSTLMIDFSSFAYVKKILSFRCTGVFTLLVSVVYFSKRVLDPEDWMRVLRCLLYPGISTIVFLVINRPDYSKINFSGETSAAVSGGFGGNQVTALLGLYVGLIGLCQLNGIRKVLPGITLGMLLFGSTFFGLITFSRGGMLGGLLACIAGSVFSMGRWLKPKVLIAGLVALMLGAVAVYQVNEITDGSLLRRYSKADGESWNDYSTHRFSFAEGEIQMFFDNPILGTGPAPAAADLRKYGFSRSYRPHTEYSRLLGQHGLAGLATCILILMGPVVRLAGRASDTRRNLMIFMAMVAWATMFHSATRMAFPMLCLGLAFSRFPAPLMRSGRECGVHVRSAGLVKMASAGG